MATIEERQHALGESPSAKAHGLANSDFEELEARPRCPACWGLACPTCHRADMVKVIWDLPRGDWHALCQRCHSGFASDE